MSQETNAAILVLFKYFYHKAIDKLKTTIHVPYHHSLIG